MKLNLIESFVLKVCFLVTVLQQNYNFIDAYPGEYEAWERPKFKSIKTSYPENKKTEEKHR